MTQQTLPAFGVGALTVCWSVMILALFPLGVFALMFWLVIEIKNGPVEPGTPAGITVLSGIALVCGWTAKLTSLIGLGTGIVGSVMLPHPFRIACVVLTLVHVFLLIGMMVALRCWPV
jgi:hypothetical protein